jgi:hypothetical protein
MQCVAEADDENVPSGWKINFADENETYGQPVPLTATCGL